MTAGLEDVVIVGAGECGTRAALELRSQGYEGRLTLVGNEVHAPYERPPLSKQVASSAEVPQPKTIATLEELEALGIAYQAGIAATAIDRSRKTLDLSDGRSLRYDKLLLATGAQPRPLRPDIGHARVLYLRSYDSALLIRRQFKQGQRVVIIGGGFIGLELAASARHHDCTVTVVEALPRLLMRGVSEIIATAIEARHQAENVTIIAGSAIVSIASRGPGLVVTLGGGQELLADIVIAGIGAEPDINLGVAAGLMIDNGIAVDAELKTSDPTIFAAGDCCSFPLPVYGGRRVRLESWRSAQDQGRLAARNMLGAGDAISTVPWFWSDQYDLGLQIAGLVDEGTAVVRRELEQGFVLFHLDGDGRLVAASGLGAGNSVARSVRLAEMLILQRAVPSPSDLANPECDLKRLLTR